MERPERPKRFESALDVIIAADDAYVSNKDLRNGHHLVMQRLVWGGAIRNKGNNGTKMTMEEGLEKYGIVEGINEKIRGPGLFF